jgi:hypothetical protein
MARTQSLNLGPGLLKIGATGTEVDASCWVNNCTIASDKSADDDRTMLCGDVLAGAVTYTFSLTGNVDTDIDTPDGLFALSQDEAGTQQDFTFTPNTEIGTTATGVLTIDPLDFGADEMGQPLQSDFEFAIVGKPTYAYGAAVEGAEVEGAEVEEPAA